MKKTLSLLAVLAVAGVASSPAQASNPYVSAMAGINWPQSTSFTYTTDYVPTYWDSPSVTPLSFSNGFTGVVAVGCNHGSFRTELEAGYQRSKLNDIPGYNPGYEYGYDGEDTVGELTGAKASVYSLMANAFYDIPVGHGVKLYGMVGLGVAQVNLKGSSSIADYWGEAGYYNGSSYSSYEPNYSADPTSYEAHATTLAYQLGAGITIPVGKGVNLDARYRYFATTDFTISGPDYTEPLAIGGSYENLWVTPQYNTHFSSHSVLVGVRFDI
jgi:opacity protein-like surface antigen